MKNQLKKKLRRNKQEREIGYPNAVVVVKLSSGDTKCTQATDHLRQGTSMHVLNKKYPIVKFGDLSDKQTVKWLRFSFCR
ncbi:hypothetical protein Bca4012_035632 [Brassica carinata]|uniref:Uncharacterized protein n=1 Tax=Brassica carinata TaxID=52824 RepID=A0A8X8B931_BRACI|nr:hypothetical protein Bca52824_009423 [Brassica carinata]